jgi:hypothetical protein
MTTMVPKKNPSRWLTAALLATGVAGAAMAQSAPFSSPAPVSLTPSATSVPAGANITVDVNVDLTGITGRCNLSPVPAVLGGYAIPVNFDKSRLRFVSSSACTTPEFNVAPITTTVPQANAMGQVAIAASHSSQRTPTGRVCVARLTFQAFVPGTASLLPDIGGTSLSSSFQTCGVTSGGPAAIPATVVGTEVRVEGDQPVGKKSIIPVVVSSPGANNTSFKTSLQLHNAGDAAISGKLIFHPAGFPGGEGDPSLAYTLQPGHTLDYADILPAMGQSGIGSMDVVSTGFDLPAVTARIFNDAANLGTNGLSEGQVLPQNALQPGDRAVLICPRDNEKYRYNVGIRTLEEGATLTVTLRTREGAAMKTFSRTLPATYYMQQSAAEFIGITPGPNEVIVVQIESGSAIIYGATTDNRTGDPAMKLAERVPIHTTTE